MNKTPKELLEEISNENIKEFTESKYNLNLLEKYNIDKNRAEEYHRRELLELLQNVDDAYEDLCRQKPNKKGLRVETLIEYDEEKYILRVSNKGTVFNENSISRLCQGGVSPKKLNFIGSKGIGFRSVLNWAKEIHIYSGDYSVGFSEEYANKILDTIKDKEIIQKQLSENKNIKIPMLRVPYYIDPQQNNFDTVIEILVKPETLNDNWNIINQINEFDKTILLFLPNITSIRFKIKNNESIIEYSFNKEKDINEERFNKFSIQKLDNINTILDEQSFFVFKTDFEQEQDNEIKKVQLAVAIPCKIEQNNKHNNLYTFFPIKEMESPFIALLNATFDLSDNRDYIKSKDINLKIFEKLLEFYVNTIVNNFCIVEFEDLAIKLLTPIKYEKNFRFQAPFNDYSSINKYIELCRDKKIFLNCNNEFISAEDCPKIIQGQYPTLFHNTNFKELISHPNQEIINFLQDLSNNDNYIYSIYDLCERINLSKINWTIENNIEVFIWWITQYPKCEVLPTLIKDNKGNWLEIGDKCFFSGTITDIPNWASYKIIDLEYEQKLIDYCCVNCRYELDLIKKDFASSSNTSDKRLVIRFIGTQSLIKTMEYSVSNLLSPLNSCICNDYNRAIDFIKWIWKNNEDIKKSDSIKDNNYNFPNQEKGVSLSGSLFVGIEYNNPFGEKLFKNSDLKKVVNPEDIEIPIEEIDNAKNFFNEFFGILVYPKIYRSEPKFQCTEYEDILKKYVKEDILKTKGKKVTCISTRDFKVDTITNLEYILSNLDTNSIINFIFSYEELYNNIKNVENDNYDNLKYDTFRSAYRYNFYSKIPNYLTFVFGNTKWLEIGGKKYSPNECIFSDDSILYRHTPCITTDYIKKINIDGHSEKEIKKLLEEYLNVKDREIELSSNNFYRLLLSLQKEDNTNKISQKIYRDCTKNSNLIFEDSDNKKKFFESGKVCVKNPKEDRSVYQSINEVYFSGKIVLNLTNRYLINIPLRTGNKADIEKIFNVKEYIENYEVIKDSLVYSNINNEFKKKFKEYLPYAFCLRKEDASETEQKKFKNLNINLVSKIKIKLDSVTKDVTENYALIQDKENESQWYIYVGDIEKFEDINTYTIGDLLEQIFAVIINTENKDKIDKFSQLYVEGKEGREHIIRKEFNSLGILQDSKNFFNDIISDKDIFRDYLKKENLLTDEILELLNQLDFSLINNDLETQKILFKLLQKLNMDVDSLNTKLDRNDISVCLYNKQRLKETINNIMKKIKLYIYHDLSLDKPEKQKQFLELIDNVEEEINNDINIENTINFNPINECENYYKQNYGKEYEFIDIQEIFKNNLKQFKEKNEKNTKYSKFINSKEIKSLLYFNNIEYVQKEFDNFILNSSNERQEETKVEDDRTNIVVNSIFKDIEHSSNNKYKEKHNYRTVSTDEEQEKSKKNQKQGDLAEQDIVNKLRLYEFSEINNLFNSEKYNTNWCSGAAQRLENINGDDSLGYDIELEYNGKKIYIEVKSCANCSFNMSSRELNFARNNVDNYRLILVRHSEIHIFPKDFFNNKKFEILGTNYEIRFNL